MIILDTRGRCFVRTQHELSVTAALKVHKIKTRNLAQENNAYLRKFILTGKHTLS